MLQLLTVIHLLNLDGNVSGLKSGLLSLVLLTRLLISLLDKYYNRSIKEIRQCKTM